MWQETLARYRAHDGTVAGLVATRAAVDPVRALLWFEGRTWSWGEVEAASARAAGWLARRGVGRGDRVAVIAGNCDTLVILFLALARLGAAFVPVNPALTPSEARWILEHAEPRVVVAAADLDELAAADGPAAPAVGRPDDTVAILYTSGTTGFPKGVEHAQRTFCLAAECFVERLHLTPDDRLLCILPLFHVNALFYSLGGALAAGASLALAPRFSAAGFWRLAADSGATTVNIIATVGHILARRPREELVAHRIAKLYGSPVPPEVAEIFHRDFGVPHVTEGYGMTEIPGAASVPFDGPERPGSFGCAARHPPAELRVVDDDGRDLPPGATGELWVRTPLVMKGYFRDPAATAAAFRDGGWFATGDLVRRDADGFCTFVARRKDIIRRRGENVSGAELDRVLGEHPAIVEAAAIAVPSELGEDEILAVLVTRAPLAAADVAAWCAGRLAAHKVPRYVAFVDALPKTPTHRVAKFKLAAEREALLARAADLATPGGPR